MTNTIRRTNVRNQDSRDLIEALGEVITAASELQGRLLRSGVTVEMLASAQDHKLRYDLLRQAGNLNVERALVEFDAATQKAMDARHRRFGKATHPTISLEELAHSVAAKQSPNASREAAPNGQSRRAARSYA